MKIKVNKNELIVLIESTYKKNDIDLNNAVQANIDYSGKYQMHWDLFKLKEYTKKDLYKLYKELVKHYD
jgi:hypothetical protein